MCSWKRDQSTILQVCSIHHFSCPSNDPGMVSFIIPLQQWCLNLNSLESLFRHSLGLTPISDSVFRIWGGTSEFAFLSHPQLILILLVQGPCFETYCILAPVFNLLMRNREFKNKIPCYNLKCRYSILH